MTEPPAGPQLCTVCGGLVPLESKWPDIHPACRMWPDSGIKYGPDWRDNERKDTR
jgi:hypothetical protein